MQIEFTVSGLKPRQRRRGRPAHKAQTVSPALRSIVLAFQIEKAVRDGRARDYADIARQIGMTRARVSQIMRLLRLPPALIEKLLLTDPTHVPKLTERQLRSLTTASLPVAQLEVLDRLHSDG